MPQITVHVEIRCGKCKSLLDYEWQPAPNGFFRVLVTACRTCMNNARDDARENGYRDGREQGRHDKGE